MRNLSLDEEIQTMIDFDLDGEVQGQLEETVRKIILMVHTCMSSNDYTTTIREKGRGDEQIDIDVIAKEIIFKDYERYPIFTEEGSNRFSQPTSELVVADPIDGSSEVNRMGAYSNPLSTSIMVVRNDRVIAASAGDIWKKYIYGIDQKGLYIVKMNDHNASKSYIFRNSNAFSHPSIRLAAYARNSKRAEIAKTINDLLSSGDIAYFGNDGGGMFPIQVALGRGKGYNCAAELLPKELYEHITAIMATTAGAKLSRLDGSPFEVNPLIRQTSIIAVNDAVREMLIQKLKKTYQTLNIAHVEPIYGTLLNN